MNENRRTYKSEEKLKIVIEGLSGSIQISELCKKYGIQSSRFYERKKKLMKSSVNVFDDRGRKNTSNRKVIEEQEKKLERLKETITEIVTENLQLKKNIGNFRGKT